MADTQAKKYSDAELTAALRKAAYKLPYALRQHIDVKRISARNYNGPDMPAWKKAGHIAAVQDGSRNVVDIIDPKTFMEHPSQLTAHEVTHLIQNSTSDADQAKYAKNPTPDPYNYGGTQGLIQARAQGKKLQDFSPEQQAEILQYAQAHNDDYDAGSPEGKAQWDAQRPVYDAYTNDLNNWKMTADPNAAPITSDSDPNLYNVQVAQPNLPSTQQVPAYQPQPVASQPAQPAVTQNTVQTGVFHAMNVYQFGDAAPGEPNNAPTGVTFDAPSQSVTTVTVPASSAGTSNNAPSGGAPAGLTFDAPLQQAQSVSVPVQPQTQNQPTPQVTQPVQATVSATPGSMPNDPTSQKIANWAANVQSDLKHGTSITGVGRFLKSLGAHGLDFGVSPQVADFMGSIPLGLLQAVKGRAETFEPGQFWKGNKDIAGGLANASQIPASIVSPEAGDIAGDAADTIAAQAGRAVKAVKAPFSAEAIQPELQQGIRDAVNAAAKDLGVQPSNSASIRDVANEVAQAAKSKAHGMYASLDNAVGGTRFQTYQEQLNDALAELRSSISEVDPDAHGELVEKINNLESAKQKAYQSVRDAGLDPQGMFDKAQNLWRQGSALEDLGSHVEKSTTGMRPELAANPAKTNPEAVSTAKIFNRANQAYNDGRLKVALGEDKAKQLLQTIDSAHLQALKIAARQRVAKLAGRIALWGGGYEALRHGAAHLLGE